MSNNNNSKSKSAISLQESWASNLSDYILLRRQQTHVAYDAADAKINDKSKKIGKSEDSDLFTTLFVILAAHLEEGHTVLTIDAADHEAPMQGQINGEDVTLYAWQQQLLEILATPIFVLIDTQIKTQIDTQPDDDTKTEVSLFVLLDTLFGQREYLWAQL
ncbi:MAG: exodeoxyribonuclease V subunit alpha, partial [Psychrobacter sp.]